MYNSKSKPKETVERELAEVPLGKYINGNNEGELRDVHQAYELNREGKKEARKAKGITSEKELSNILNAIEQTSTKDLKARAAAGDSCLELPGIVQRFGLFPICEIYFHSRSNLVLMGELARMGRLVLAEDATAELWDLQDTKYQGKFQHTKLMMQATECILSKNDADVWSRELFHPMQMAERVSHSNTAQDFARWTLKLREDTRIVTKSAFGVAIDPIPIVLRFDCALELLNGAVLGYRKKHQVDTGKMYNNVVLAIILRYERITASNNDPAFMVNCARKAMRIIRKHCGPLYKQCDVHVFDRMYNLCKHMTNRPIEMTTYKEQFNTINHHIAREMKRLDRLVDIIARLGAIVAFFSLKTLPCPRYDIDSTLRDHHDQRKSWRIARRMHRLILQSNHLVECPNSAFMNMCIQAELGNIGMAEEDQRFKGHVLGRIVIDWLKKHMKVAVPYLKSVDKKNMKGTINICYVYSCYGIDPGGKEIIRPQRTGGVSVTVDLPMTENSIINPLYSERASRYWLTQWLSRAPLWSKAVITVAELAIGARLFSNNQGLEGKICYEKHGVSTVKEDMGDASSLVIRRWQDCLRGGRMFGRQARRASSKISDRKIRSAKKNRNKPSQMKWKRKPISMKAKLLHYEKKMERALSAAATAGDIKRCKSRRSKWSALSEHATFIDSTFMGHSTFSEWLGGNRLVMLTGPSRKVIDHLFSRYFEAGEVSDSDDELN